MRKFLLPITIFVGLLCISGIILSTQYTRIKPNYVGVYMQNFGKKGKSDFSIQKGIVNTMGIGTDLWQVPLFEQTDNFESKLKLKSADNTEFTAFPTYTYQIKNDDISPIDIVFNNKHLSQDSFLNSLEKNILKPKIFNLIREESRKYVTDTLMSNGGSLRFERRLEKYISKMFNKQGFILTSFSSQLEFSKKVTDKIDTRNEVNTNISVINQLIIEQVKKNELADLRVKERLIQAKGDVNYIIKQKFIDKWDGKTPLYINNPLTIQDISNK